MIRENEGNLGYREETQAQVPLHNNALIQQFRNELCKMVGAFLLPHSFPEKILTARRN